MISDQHDLVPELYESRFQRGKDLLYRGVVALAPMTPIVSFERREARVSAGEAAGYVPCNDTDAFAATTSALLDDPIERQRGGTMVVESESRLIQVDGDPSKARAA